MTGRTVYYGVIALYGEQRAVEHSHSKLTAPNKRSFALSVDDLQTELDMNVQPSNGI